MYDRYQKVREGLNIEEAMVIKISALDVTGFAKLLRTVYIDENAAGDGYAVCLRHFLCAAGKQDSIFTKADSYIYRRYPCERWNRLRNRITSVIMKKEF